MKIFTPPAGGLTNPMTTLGDAIVGAASGTPARIAVGSNGQYLGADSTATNGVSYQSPANNYNFLVNGGFDYWQSGTSTTVTATGGGTPSNTGKYQADQWFCDNVLGGGTVEGIITYDQVAGSLDGSLFGARFKITTAPTGTGIGNGLFVIQPISNIATASLYNKTASFAVQVKALGNVNSINIAFVRASTETLPVTVISSTNVSVNTSGFTNCVLNGVALGNAMTTSGIVGVQISINTVSSGNTYDLNNGFIIEQAIVNLGPVAQAFQRQYRDPAQELTACQFFYEKSYDITVNPGTSTNIGLHIWVLAVSGGFNGTTIYFKAKKRATPSISSWDAAGNASKISYFNNGAWARTDNQAVITNTTIGVNSFYTTTAISPGAVVSTAVHWAADARIA